MTRTTSATLRLPKHQEAYEFSLPKKEETAAELRRLADGIERGEIFVQTIEYGRKSRVDDFAVTSISMSFVDKADA